jgi:ABC-type dipeptide/oligopeptide/nickel transport system ATPase component
MAAEQIPMPQEAMPNPETEIKLRKMELEAYKLAKEIEMAEEKHAMEMMNNGVAIERDETGKTKARAQNDLRSEQIGMQVLEAMTEFKDVMSAQAKAIQEAADKTAESQDKSAQAQAKTVEVLKKPRRILREKGKIVGIKIED